MLSYVVVRSVREPWKSSFARLFAWPFSSHSRVLLLKELLLLVMKLLLLVMIFLLLLVVLLLLLAVLLQLI